MKTEKYNYAERLALYIAQRSVGKSIPLVVHKVPKPENLAKMLEKISEEQEKNMQKKILTEKTLKEATIKACETELRMYDKLIEETASPAFSDKFEKEMQKIIEKK